MIYDYGTQVTATFPGNGVNTKWSADSIDLTAGGDGVPALFGHGERLYMQFEVTSGFNVGLGSPRAMFGVAIDDTQSLGASAHVLGFTGGSTADASVGPIGYEATQLTTGVTFHLPIPSWEDVMEEDEGTDWPVINTPASLLAFRGMKWLGIVIYNPTVSASHYFDAGTVAARIVKDPTTAQKSNLYGSRMGVL